MLSFTAATLLLSCKPTTHHTHIYFRVDCGGVFTTHHTHIYFRVDCGGVFTLGAAAAEEARIARVKGNIAAVGCETMNSVWPFDASDAV
jgi:hypothetical protein